MYIRACDVKHQPSPTIFRRRNIFQLLLKYLNDEYLIGPLLCVCLCVWRGGWRRHVEHYICTIIFHTRKMFPLLFFSFVRSTRFFQLFFISTYFLCCRLCVYVFCALFEICLSCECYLWIIYFCLAIYVKQILF